MDGEELTEEETALYDRQIRVWGVDAQKRLSKAHILVSGLNGTAVEFCKNMVLAGVGNLTLMDDRPVTEDVLQSNFLIPPDEAYYSGRSLDELCCESLKDFNPMVRVSIEKGDLSQFDGEFFDKFDAVVVSCCSLKIKKAINEKCRRRPRRVALYAIECRGSCGEIFIDLQNYTYIQKKSDGTAECQLKYPSLEEAISIPWRDLPRKVSKVYFAMRVIERFELSEGRKPGETSISDLPLILRLRKELCDAQSLSESHVPVSLLERMLAAGGKEHPPVCATLGGVLGQVSHLFIGLQVASTQNSWRKERLTETCSCLSSSA
ncbi:SUMO-activating enzyme subunit 1B-1-like isoform X2 [Phoenix dactylifera]|uniref:Ubiquitin-like 1-activating enzyme E1A n=1 Tax=Phoenix dactylifera TaxID=42345 RepID=A0A8B8JC45_PHODC|nr:SUMO-activating enzyme subunit 1B-1-like isoform X2 [Phoenix dactylifera]